MFPFQWYQNAGAQILERFCWHSSMFMPQSSWWQCQEDLQHGKNETRPHGGTSANQRMLSKVSPSKATSLKKMAPTLLSLGNSFAHFPVQIYSIQDESFPRPPPYIKLATGIISKLETCRWLHIKLENDENTAWISMISHNNDSNNETERKGTGKRTKLDETWKLMKQNEIIVDPDFTSWCRPYPCHTASDAWISATDKSRLPISKVRMTSPSGHGENNKQMFINESLTL